MNTTAAGASPVDCRVRPLVDAAAWLARRSDWPAGKWEAFKGSEPPHWASAADPLYSLTPEDVAAVNAARKDRASKALRRLDLCRCDHNEYCGHCFPVEFRPGGVWGGPNK